MNTDNEKKNLIMTEEEEKKAREEEKKRKKAESRKASYLKKKEKNKKYKERLAFLHENYQKSTPAERVQKWNTFRQMGSRVPKSLLEELDAPDSEEHIEELEKKENNNDKIIELVEVDPEEEILPETDEKKLKEKEAKKEEKNKKKYHDLIKKTRKQCKGDMKTLGIKRWEIMSDEIDSNRDYIRRTFPGGYPNATKEQIDEMNKELERVAKEGYARHKKEFKKDISNYIQSLNVIAKTILKENKTWPTAELPEPRCMKKIDTRKMYQYLGFKWAENKPEVKEDKPNEE